MDRAQFQSSACYCTDPQESLKLDHPQSSKPKEWNSTLGMPVPFKMLESNIYSHTGSTTTRIHGPCHVIRSSILRMACHPHRPLKARPTHFLVPSRAPWTLTRPRTNHIPMAQGSRFTTTRLRIGRLPMRMFILFCFCDEPRLALHASHMYSQAKTLLGTGEWSTFAPDVLLTSATAACFSSRERSSTGYTQTFVKAWW